MARLIRRRALTSGKKDAWPEAGRFPKQFLLKIEMTGNELKALRAAFRLSQSQLAGILGVTVVTIKRAERTKDKEFPSRLLKSLLAEAQLRGQLKLPQGERKVPEDYAKDLEAGLSFAEKPAQYGQAKKRQGKKPRKKS